MSRPSDWWVLDLEGDPVPGDTVAVASMARSWSGLAEDAQWAEARVRQLVGDGAVGAWIGEAGDAFRTKTGELPEQLGRCAASYRLAAETLEWWAGRLVTHQADADTALVRGRVARQELEAAQAAAASAAAAADAAAGSRVLTDPSLTPSPEQVREARQRHASAQSAAASANAAVADAQARLDAARRLALDAAALRDGDARVAADRIHEASDAGIPKRSAWEKLTDWAGEAWDVIVTLAKVVVAVLGVVALIVGGPLAWVVFAAALLVLADTLAKYLQGQASWWDIAFAALACIPGTKGLTTLTALNSAFRTGGTLGAVAHLGVSARTAIVQMARSVRSFGPGTLRRIRSLGGPRGWTGEGLQLAGGDLRLVESFANDAMRFEPGVSRSLSNMVADLPTSELAGFGARLKSFDSVARKAATAVEVEGLTVTEALGGIKDSIRYTVMTPGQDFASASAQVSDRLAAEGFENISFKNTFGADGYQGVNTTWRDPATGHAFEVQFHTPESFAAKTETHILYEEARLPGTTPARYADLVQQQEEIFGAVPQPADVRDVSLPAGSPVAERGGVYVPDPVGDYWRKPFQATGYAGVGAGVLPPMQQEPTR